MLPDERECRGAIASVLALSVFCAPEPFWADSWWESENETNRKTGRREEFLWFEKPRCSAMRRQRETEWMVTIVRVGRARGAANSQLQTAN